MEKGIILCVIILMTIILLKCMHLKRKEGNIKQHHKVGHKHGEGFSIDFYAYNSKIRGWNSTFKVCSAVTILILCIVLNNPYVSVTVIIAMAYVTIVKGGLPIGEYLYVLAIPAAFIFISTVTIAIDFSKQPMGEYNVYLGFCYVFTSKIMLEKAILLLLKVFAAISALQAMTLSTPSCEIISVLRKAHVPKLIIELMNMIYRYIFILMDVYTKMKNSAESRLGYCDLKTSYYTFGNIASNMLITSFKKANSYYDAMEARCYDGELLFLQEDKKVEGIQIVVVIVFIICLILLWKFTK